MGQTSPLSSATGVTSLLRSVMGADGRVQQESSTRCACTIRQSSWAETHPITPKYPELNTRLVSSGLGLCAYNQKVFLPGLAEESHRHQALKQGLRILRNAPEGSDIQLNQHLDSHFTLTKERKMVKQMNSNIPALVQMANKDTDVIIMKCGNAWYLLF